MDMFPNWLQREPLKSICKNIRLSLQNAVELNDEAHDFSNELINRTTKVCLNCGHAKYHEAKRIWTVRHRATTIASTDLQPAPNQTGFDSLAFAGQLKGSHQLQKPHAQKVYARCVGTLRRKVSDRHTESGNASVQNYLYALPPSKLLQRTLMCTEFLSMLQQARDNLSTTSSGGAQCPSRYGKHPIDFAPVLEYIIGARRLDAPRIEALDALLKRAVGATQSFRSRTSASFGSSWEINFIDDDASQCPNGFDEAFHAVDAFCLACLSPGFHSPREIEANKFESSLSPLEVLPPLVAQQTGGALSPNPLLESYQHFVLADTTSFDEVKTDGRDVQSPHGRPRLASNTEILYHGSRSENSSTPEIIEPTQHGANVDSYNPIHRGNTTDMFVSGASHIDGNREQRINFESECGCKQEDQASEKPPERSRRCDPGLHGNPEHDYANALQPRSEKRRHRVTAVVATIISTRSPKPAWQSCETKSSLDRDKRRRVNVPELANTGLSENPRAAQLEGSPQEIQDGLLKDDTTTHNEGGGDSTTRLEKFSRGIIEGVLGRSKKAKLTPTALGRESGSMDEQILARALRMSVKRSKRLRGSAATARNSRGKRVISDVSTTSSQHTCSKQALTQAAPAGAQCAATGSNPVRSFKRSRRPQVCLPQEKVKLADSWVKLSHIGHISDYHGLQRQYHSFLPLKFSKSVADTQASIDSVLASVELNVDSDDCDDVPVEATWAAESMRDTDMQKAQFQMARRREKNAIPQKSEEMRKLLVRPVVFEASSTLIEQDCQVTSKFMFGRCHTEPRAHSATIIVPGFWKTDACGDDITGEVISGSKRGRRAHLAAQRNYSAMLLNELRNTLVFIEDYNKGIGQDGSLLGGDLPETAVNFPTKIPGTNTGKLQNYDPVSDKADGRIESSAATDGSHGCGSANSPWAKLSHKDLLRRYRQLQLKGKSFNFLLQGNSRETRDLISTILADADAMDAVDEEVALDERQQSRAFKTYRGKADQERIEKKEHEEQRHLFLREFEYTNRGRKPPPQELQCNLLLSEAIVFGEQPKGPPKHCVCILGKECTICFPFETTTPAAMKESFDLVHHPRFRKVHLDAIKEEREITEKSRRSRITESKSKKQSFLRVLSELFHSLAFIEKYNQGFLETEGKNSWVWFYPSLE